ncbi:MAG: HAD-IB family hydrolase [gamma proteobacterium symbiont of Taylorina sp.]|nr:HAD-IB family hydrolase [gamma proteobacterium symbiont of Taylorina sp.]
MNLALFDFDGTISNKDSLADFIIYALGKYRYYYGLIILSPILLAWKLKIFNAEQAKIKLLWYFFKNWNESDFRKSAYRYSTQRLEYIIRSKAKEKIAWHQSQGDRVVVVSASLKCWLQGWCQQQKIQLIATEWLFYDQMLSENMLTKNCQGQEKVNRIREAYNLEKFERIYAYGDSKGDSEMLDLAHEAYYRPFR